MKYRILIGETARKQLKSLQDGERERILSNLEELELYPRKRRAKADIKKLHISGYVGSDVFGFSGSVDILLRAS